MGKNRSNSNGTIIEAELTPEGLRRLQQKTVKPSTPRNQEELDRLITNIKKQISSTEDKLGKLQETLDEGGNDLNTHMTLIYSIEDEENRLREQRNRLEHLENTHFF